MSQVDHDVDKEDEEETYVAVLDEDDQQQQDEDKDRDKDDDGDGDGEDDGDGEGAEDKRLGAGEPDDDEDAKRAQRREEGKKRRQRQKEARERDKRELDFLRQRNEAVERQLSELSTTVDTRLNATEIGSVDTRIAEANRNLQLANQVIAKAASENNGEDLAEALNYRDDIRDNLMQLNQAKDALSTRETEGGEDDFVPDPRTIAHAERFMGDHTWWDPMGRDADSLAVLRLDRQLVTERYDPATPEYWDELRKRTKELIPGRFESDTDTDDDDADPNADKGGDKRRGGPTFRTGGRERPLKKNEVYISKERREAMEEAGVWQDPVLRNRMLKRYADYDRDAANGQQGA